MDKHLISIIIPCYNGESYIERCINALKAQTHVDFEVLIVDDGSTDGSVELLKKLTAGDQRFQVFTKVNEGPVKARDYALQRFTGDFLVFCDIDDYLPATALETLYSKAVDTSADIVVGDFAMVSGSRQRKKKYRRFSGIDGKTYLKYLLSGYAGWQICAKLYTRQLIKEHDVVVPEKVVLGDDASLVTQLAPFATRVESVDSIVYYYVQNASSLTHQRGDKPADRYFEAPLFIESRLNEVGIKTEYESYISSFWLLSLSAASRAYGLRLDRGLVRNISRRHLYLKALNHIPIVKRYYILFYVLTILALGKTHCK